MENNPMTVGDVRKKLESFQGDTPVFVSGDKALFSIFNIKECEVKSLEGYRLNINDHKCIREARRAIVLEAYID